MKGEENKEKVEKKRKVNQEEWVQNVNYQNVDDTKR